MLITDTATQTTYTTTEDMIASFTDTPEEITTAAQELADMLDSWEAGATLNSEAQELADYLGLTIA